MSYISIAYKVMIASPTDVDAERSIIREAISRWNNAHSEHRKIVLMPIGWETHSAPEMGARPQDILNRQIADSCDLLIGVFWTRIGTATGEYASGSVEEIENHMRAGRPTMLYFSGAPVEYGSVDRTQYDKLTEFKKSCRDRGVYNEYSDLNNFRQKLDSHLQIRLNEEIFVGYNQTKPEAFASFPPVGDIPKLSREAQILLTEAARGDGQILRLELLKGTVVKSGGKRFTEDTPRSIAIWDGSVNELEQYMLIHSPGTKRQIFRVTRQGYELAALLNP